ncbi:MAG: T9SS type A sorting domain-containing protein [Prevotellaceae bacterium]|jgi:exo-beta-1,3-glucanase (GH17 family)|nr:T9SS type A sorting domain-containing protein [Prevotellaceae bacterium]
MKTCKFFKNVTVTAVIMFAVNIAGIQAQPQIEMTCVPPTGEGGIAEGKVVWSELTAENADQYAIIAILRAPWGDDYAKPTYANYLNPIDAYGYFFIDITTEVGDEQYSSFNFYLVSKATFAGIGGEQVKSGTMTGRYLGEPAIVNRSDMKWTLKSPEPNIRPGFADAGTTITLSSREEGLIRYTVDGSDPATSPSAQIYSNTVNFSVPSAGYLIIKAVTEKDGVYSNPASMLWMPKEPYTAPLFGVNVSLALGGEPWGHALSEDETAARISPVVPIAKWVRTFGTVGNGLPYINKIAKSKGLRTMIGVYITGDMSGNNAEQLLGLRKILQTGPAPDLIAVGNETIGTVSPAVIAECIDSVRRILKDFNLILPVGSADIGGASWSSLVMNKLDFVGVNLYPGTWDNVPETEMLNVLKQSYSNELERFKSRCVLLTETGTPYAGAPYKPLNTNYTQTPSTRKAAEYLKGASEWSKENSIPLFYFEAYDEPVKSQNGGHNIEQYFGLMNKDLEIHSFYKSIIGSSDANLSGITVNGKQIDINNPEYAVNCEENSLVLDLQCSPHVTVKVNETAYVPGQRIDITDDITSVNIQLISETGVENFYTLKVITPVNERKLYYQRWNDVIAINRNPVNNGGYSVSDIRWYTQDGTFISEESYIQIQESASNYYAEIQIDNEWRRVCGVPERKTADKIIAYPNPVPRGESLKLQLPKTFAEGILNIYSISGKLQKSGLPLPATYIDVDVSSLNSGIYLMYVSGKDENPLMTKIIIE